MTDLAPAGDPRDFLGDHQFDQLGQILVEPRAEHRLEHLAHQPFERVGARRLRASRPASTACRAARGWLRRSAPRRSFRARCGGRLRHRHRRGIGDGGLGRDRLRPLLPALARSVRARRRLVGEILDRRGRGTARRRARTGPPLSTSSAMIRLMEARMSSIDGSALTSPICSLPRATKPRESEVISSASFAGVSGAMSTGAFNCGSSGRPCDESCAGVVRVLVPVGLYSGLPPKSLQLPLTLL